jgi:hypothetical protein
VTKARASARAFIFAKPEQPPHPAHPNQVVVGIPTILIKFFANASCGRLAAMQLDPSCRLTRRSLPTWLGGIDRTEPNLSTTEGVAEA